MSRFDGIDAASGLRRRFGYYVSTESARIIDWPRSFGHEEAEYFAEKFKPLTSLSGRVGRENFTLAAWDLWKRVQRENREQCASLGISVNEEAKGTALNESPARILKLALIFQASRWARNQRLDPLEIDAPTLALAAAHQAACLDAAACESFPRRQSAKRTSKLDGYKPVIVRWLERHPYSAAQVFQRLKREEGYTGGETILKAYVRAVRPVHRPAYLMLAFAPGEAAQVDWGYAGTIALGATRRRLSFFVMVLCHSRQAYVEFTCGECMEHFLACHQNAVEFFGGTPGAVIIDNLKTGVLRHRLGEKALFHPRYLDFAAHYGFEPRACNVREANEKGRVEYFVAYVKKNFLRGLELPTSLSALNVAVRQWLETVANVRLHGETHKRPVEVFRAVEKPALRPLPAQTADTSVTRLVRVTNRCRVIVDTNRYSVPSLYASQRLTLKAYANRLCLYHAHNLVATHPRCYERHRDFEDPDHVKDIREQRRRARDASWLRAFYALSPQAEFYHQQLSVRSLQSRLHVNRIIALADIYGAEKVARALEDAIECQAFASQYIENILQQRARLCPPSGPLHLTRRADLLEIDLDPVDLTPYDPPEPTP